MNLIFLSSNRYIVSYYLDTIDLKTQLNYSLNFHFPFFASISSCKRASFIFLSLGAIEPYRWLHKELTFVYC